MEEHDKQESMQADCKTDKNHGLNHILMMLACCMVPLGGALILRYLGYGTYASYLVFLLCPLMHLFMMKDMFKGKNNESNANSE
jgi:uncharacterized membrane protein